MNVRFLVSLSFAGVLGIVTVSSQAVEYRLFDWGFNLDSTSYCLGGPCDFDVLTNGNISGPGDIPNVIDTIGFDFGTGLGKIETTITGAGTHRFLAFFDHDIDELINTNFNETGSISGTPAAGQTWEIDEPGFGAGGAGAPKLGTGGTAYFGDIFNNFLADTLDAQMFFDAIDNQFLVPPVDDVSMAVGWNFGLVSDETGVIAIDLATDVPAGGFYVVHEDPDSNASIYLSSSLRIVGVPEPESVMLMAVGLLGLFGLKRWRRN